MRQQSDTTLLRQAFKDAGFRQRFDWPPTVFNDKHKSGETRRLKLYDGDALFDAPQFAQEGLERQFKLKFGDRYLFAQFTEQNSWSVFCIGGKSLCIYLLTK
jgi:hypothetical protein